MGDIGPEDFYVVLPSNSNPESHPNNHANKYIVSWETPINFGNASDWRVALTEMSYNYCPVSVTTEFGLKVDYIEPAHVETRFYDFIVKKGQPPKMNVHNLPEGVHISMHVDDQKHITITCNKKFILVYENNVGYAEMGFRGSDIVSLYSEEDGYKIKAPYWYADTEEYVLEKLKIVFEMKGEEIKTFTRYFHENFRWNTVADLLSGMAEGFPDVFKSIKKLVKIGEEENLKATRVIIHLKDNVQRVEFLNGFHFVLGFNQPVMERGERISEFPPQLSIGITHMYIYASICAPIQVGHTRVPLLKTIFVDGNNEDVDKREVKNVNIKQPMYVPINSASTNNIEINIRSDSGRLVQFNPGAVTCITLHFKRIRHD